MIVCYNVYEQTAYSRTCDFRAEFLFEDEETRRETRVLLPEARFGRYAYLSGKWLLEDASVSTKLTMELRLPLAWKDLGYYEFRQAVSKMATDWLEQRICELENDFSEIIYDPDTVFQQKDVRDMLLGPYSYGGAQIMRNVVLSFYRGEPVELGTVTQLDRKHYAIFQAILAHYRKHRESEQLREIVGEMNRVKAEKAQAKNADKTEDDLLF
ncbi:hypothetical protein [Neisseria sp. HMSC061B04]|uniref:hypothetical protein n=1 Tax=Neisseria sp. HMSC061B04 TaxID=1715140 RepID=UPI000AD42E6D|nr:hypothetical protein [Neisseria sp. HMSC061B04]